MSNTAIQTECAEFVRSFDRIFPAAQLEIDFMIAAADDQVNPMPEGKKSRVEMLRDRLNEITEAARLNQLETETREWAKSTNRQASAQPTGNQKSNKKLART
ncbi:MAG: hypothetical protein L0Z53_04640 [Acidobacteriales bacterium]|nr:hypothetical protein [Terriglobales bacterium]